MTDTNKFDDLLTHLGTGRWNMLYFIAASYCIFMHPAQFISGVYLAPAVNHTCLPPEGNESVFISEDSCSYSVVVEGGEEVEEACTEWLFDASVFTNTLTSEFSLVCGRSYLRALYQSVYMLGTFLSPLISGIIADRYGRKVVVAASQVCILVSSLALCFLRTVVAILSVRFILGMFNVLIFTILCLEVCEPKHRGLVCMLLGLPWGLGTMAWGGAAFLIQEWRWLQLAVSLPLVLVLPALYLMGESPRWLIVRGHHEQALRVLHKAARWNRVKLPEDRELRALIKDIQEESMTPPAMGTEGTTKKWYQRAVPSLLRTRPIQIITVVVCIDYFSVSLVFDGLNMNGDSYTSDPFLYLVLSGLAEIPAYVLAAPVIDRWGRRLPTVLIFVLCGVIITTVAFIPPELHALMMVLALTGKLCISAIFQILYLYASELFPTEVRMQGIGAATVFSQLASTLVPFITTFLGPVLPWLPSLIFGIVAAVAGVVTLALRESKGVPLPDTLADLNKTTASATSATTTSATTTTCATIATTTTRATIATITISEKDVDK